MLFLWIILLFSLTEALAGPPAAQNEVAVSRWASENQGLYFREYDLPGARSEFFQGTSVQGAPDLFLPRLGLFQPSRRLPEQASGLYSARPIWDPWTIGLNGENGLLRDPSGLEQALDTPVTRLDWQRTAFTGNSLRLDFQRSLVDSIFFDLGVVTHSTDSSGAYRYQDITHQPYLGTMKRDSSSVPLAGRNLAFDTYLMYPRLVWHTSKFSLGANITSMHIRNDVTTRESPVADTLNVGQLDFVNEPYTLRSSVDGMGLEGSLHMSPLWNASVWHHITTLKNRWTGTPRILQGIEPRTVRIVKDTTTNGTIIPAHDTTVFDTAYTSPAFWENSESQTGQVRIGLPTLHSEMVLQYESRKFSQWRSSVFLDEKGEKWEDRQLGYLGWADTIPYAHTQNQARVQLGMQRNSSIFDKQIFEPAVSLQATSLYAERLELGLALRRHQRFPDVEELAFNRTGRIQYANPSLVQESHEAIEVQIAYKRPSFSYGFALRDEATSNAIRPGWVAHPRTDSLSDTAAFQWVNISGLDNVLWRSFGGFRVGNWELWMERESSLHRKLVLRRGPSSSQIPDVPTRTYKGSVLWSNRIVNGKMKLDIRWDFEWIGARQDFALEEERAVRIDLPQNLVLNFETRMTVLTFSLYARIDNLNHTKLTPAAGYTPPGVTFRYGIQWDFKD